MSRGYLLFVTAIIEAATGLLLLAAPSVPISILLGVSEVSAELSVCARIAGAALLSIGVACWLGRTDKAGPAQRGLVTGALVYDLGAALVLAWAGAFLGFVGLALWPAVALHSGLALWCILCLPKGLNAPN
jgi:hypothetical protein